MQTLATMICDRCGVPRSYITLKGTNGMIAWDCDVCRDCYEEVKAMMLRKNRLYQKQTDEE